ncbi:MAG: HIT family protein [Anaerolineaceae bacterium]
MNEDCIFCKIVQGLSPAARVYEDEEILAFLDRFPVARYHTLVIPKAHYSSIFEIPSETLSKLILVAQKIARVYRDSLDINNLQLLNNCGKYAQQDVFHIHFHIIPRFPQDGNNIVWPKHPEYQRDFPEMLSRLPIIE